MDPRTQERVERWDSRQFTGGRDELTSLADQQFTGAVEAGGAWLFMLNGRIVGVFDGDVEDVVEASGTVYAAPDPALPLLCSMEERGGETRAKYYTNETPLSEVDRTLQEGTFTGYIELSEQVLSGDYYVVYYGGRRMAAAYIGNAERLLTGEEAFERADDEVGIYEVTTVDVEVTDIDGATGGGPDTSATTGGTPDRDPEPSTEAPNEDAGEDRSVAGSDGTAENPSPDDETPPNAGGTDRARSADVDVGSDASIADRAGAAEANDETENAAEAGDGTGITAGDDDDLQPASPGITDGRSAEDDTDAGPAVSETGGSPATADESSRSGTSDPSDGIDPDAVEAAAEELEDSDVPWASSDDDDSAPEVDERFEEEERWREARRIPSIDPDTTSDEPPSRTARTGRRSTSQSSSGSTAAGRGRPATETSSDRRSETATAGSGSADAVGSGDGTLNSDMLEREDKIDRLTQKVADLEERREELTETARTLQSERDHLRSENEELSATIERLETRIEQLEAELERSRADAVVGGGTDTGGAGATGATGGTQLSPQQAVTATNLFVRYASKRQPTLSSAHEGEGERDEVAANLQLERHTEFDAADAVVAGQPYDEYLEGTIAYQFVEWLVTTSLYEIRDTGHADALGDLYDVIPRIDRVELSAAVSLAEDDTENVPDEVTFDVVAFDKMGTPLVVANCNDAREPATREMLESLEEASSAVNANYPDLGAAFLVTSSFFDPGALEVAEEATSAGFLSRGSKISYVNLSRKQGYHLCLVEARSGGFHVAVPEL